MAFLAAAFPLGMLLCVIIEAVLQQSPSTLPLHDLTCSPTKPASEGRIHHVSNIKVVRYAMYE
jgi:hypothetical protein